MEGSPLSILCWEKALVWGNKATKHNCEQTVWHIAQNNHETFLI